MDGEIKKLGLKYTLDKKVKLGSDEVKEGEKLTKVDGQKPPRRALEAKIGAHERITQEKVIHKGLEYIIEKTEQTRTRIKKTLFLEIYRKTLGSVKATCEKVEIVRETFYDWMRNDQRFQMNIRNAWREKLEDVEQQLNLKILAGDASLIRYFLDRRHPLYKPKVKIEGPKPGERSMEDIFDEADWQNDNKEYDEETQQPISDPAKLLAKKQEGGNGAVQTEHSPVVLLEKEDKKEPNPKSPAKGNK